MNVVARRAPLGKWVVLALPELLGAPAGADASHLPGSEATLGQAPMNIQGHPHSSEELNSTPG